jgi:phosphoserine phosphatase
VGREEEVAALTRAGIDGRIDWEEGFRKRAESLRGLTQAQILRAARDLRPMPGAKEFVEWIRERDIKIVLVTGGPREVAESALALFDADAAFSNEFHYEVGVFTGDVTIHVSPRTKGEIVRDLAAKWGIPKDEILAVADGLMDLALLREAGTRLGINSDGKLRDHVDFEAADFHEARRWLRDRPVEPGIASDGGHRNP